MRFVNETLYSRLQENEIEQLNLHTLDPMPLLILL